MCWHLRQSRILFSVCADQTMCPTRQDLFLSAVTFNIYIYWEIRSRPASNTDTVKSRLKAFLFSLELIRQCRSSLHNFYVIILHLNVLLLFFLMMFIFTLFIFVIIFFFLFLDLIFLHKAPPHGWDGFRFLDISAVSFFSSNPLHKHT